MFRQKESLKLITEMVINYNFIKKIKKKKTNSKTRFSAKLENTFDKILYLYHKFFYKKQNDKISDTMIIFQK